MKYQCTCGGSLTVVGISIVSETDKTFTINPCPQCLHKAQNNIPIETSDNNEKSELVGKVGRLAY